jgi:hypothetical protein
MQEHMAATDLGRQQRAVAAALATTGSGNPLLKEEATQIRVNQTAFQFLNCLARGGIRQPFAHLPPRKGLPLEDMGHSTSKLYP